jgi:hypothetical protein
MQNRRCLGCYSYMPLEHFFAVASQCMPAFLQAASVFGVPAANAGAVNATTRLKARIEANAFMMGYPPIAEIGIKTPQSGTRGAFVLPNAATGVPYRRTYRGAGCINEGWELVTARPFSGLNGALAMFCAGSSD